MRFGAFAFASKLVAEDTHEEMLRIVVGFRSHVAVLVVQGVLERERVQVCRVPCAVCRGAWGVRARPEEKGGKEKSRRDDGFNAPPCSGPRGAGMTHRT